MYRLTLLLALLAPAISPAQNQANHWFFGANAGLDFSTGTPVATTGTISTYEGTSAVSDSITGNLLFYTDGTYVINALHNTMPNGAGLMGSNSSTQAALIVPMPGNTGKYYLFTSDAIENFGVNGYRYSVVDMSLDAGRGDVTLKNTLLYGPCGEQLAAIKHANCIDYWIMCKGYNNNTYNAYLLTSSGITGPVVSTVGTVTSTNGYGQSRFSPDGTKYAIATGDQLPFGGTCGLIQLFDFDASTGMLSNPITLLSPTVGEDAYGLSFSGDGSKLYAMRGSLASDLYQYNVALGSPAAIIASGTFIGNSPSFNQLQLGKDFKIYMAKYMQPSLSVIHNPNALGAACNFVDGAIPLIANSQLGLPNFPDSYFSQAGPCSVVPTDTLMQITVNGTNPLCHGDVNGMAVVQVTNNNGPYTAIWQPGSVAGDTLHNLGAGTYIVTVTDSVGTVLTDTVVLTSPPAITANITPGADTICAGTSVTLTANATGGTSHYAYQWSTAAGDTGTAIIISPAATVNVILTASDNNGCMVTDSVWIYVVPAAIVQAPADTCVCAGETISLTASGAPQYTWSTGDTTATISYTPTATGWLTVTYNPGACPTRDSVLVCIYPQPVLAASNDTSIIAGNEVPLMAWSSDPVTWSPSYGLSCTTCANPTALPDESVLYTVTATNAFGCTAQEQVSIIVDYILITPNIITPNGDGVNDVFKIPYLPEGSSVSIFNRWGQMVYETASYANNWNTETDGVYFYVLKIPAGKVFTGHIQVAGSR